MRRWLIAALLVLGVYLAWLWDWGDWMPPERWVRAAVTGWDFWKTPAVIPYHPPMPPIPAGAVSVERPLGFAEARAEFDGLPAEQRGPRAQEAWRRYCRHCHGDNGDGRIIVGESFAPAMPDLRDPKFQDLPESEVFTTIMRGKNTMVALDDTVTPLEAVATIVHMRSLAHAPSQPFFTPKSVEPAEPVPSSQK